MFSIRMKNILAPVTALAVALSASSALAVDYITGSVGYFDVIDGENDSTSFGLEYRFNPIEYRIRPIVGGFVTADGAAYGYAGANWDVPILSNQLYLIPNFAVGAYSHGDGKDLGGALEFRSGIELAYQMENFHRIGLAFNHMSNAGIYSKNPGVETLLVNYSLPTSVLLGN
jgi:hypothetical protein